MRFRWLEDIAEEDERRLVDLLNAVVAAGGTAVGFPGAFGSKAAERIFAEWRAGLRERRAHLLVAEGAGGVADAMVLLSRDVQPNCRHRAQVSKAMVRPRARGLAALLAGCREVASKAETLAVEVLTLDVREGTPAEALWRRLGFRQYGLLPDYARESGRQFRGILLYQPVSELRQRLDEGRAWTGPSSPRPAAPPSRLDESLERRASVGARALADLVERERRPPTLVEIKAVVSRSMGHAGLLLARESDALLDALHELLESITPPSQERNAIRAAIEVIFHHYPNSLNASPS